MTIQVSPDYWTAHVRPASGRSQFTVEEQKATYAKLAELKLIGKGCRYRYPSSLTFKTEAAALKFWKPHLDAHPILARGLEICRGFSIGF